MSSSRTSLPGTQSSLFDLTGRTAVVTGAGRGLGAGMARALAAAGAELVLVSRTAAQLEETRDAIASAGGRARIVTADLVSERDRERVADEATAAAGVDIVVHAAGVQLRKPALEVRPQEWRDVQAVNLESAYFLSTALAGAMIERGWGRHIFIGSLTSFLGLPNIAPYAATKSAVLGVVRTLAVEWAATGITVNAIVPGYFHTELTDALFRDDEKRATVMSRIPQGRLGEAEDLDGATVFLASDASSYVTGVALPVDGGWLAA